MPKETIQRAGNLPACLPLFLKKDDPVSNFEEMTKDEVVSAQKAWTEAVISQDVETLLGLYDFGSPEAPLLFKPTLANVVRHDEAGARSYFVGGNENYPHDGGFLMHGWKQIDVHSSAGPVPIAGGLAYRDMGFYTFINGEGVETTADYTFAYHKVDGRVLITLHHSSLQWTP